MKKVTIFNKLAALILMLTVVSFNVKAQDDERQKIVPSNYIFDPDSLAGFDFEAAKQGALSLGLFGEEFKVYMYREKKNYITIKYQLPAQDPFKNMRMYSKPGVLFNPSPLNGHNQPNFNAKDGGGNSIFSAACANEDFEATSAMNPVTSMVAVSGWSVYSGTHSSCVCTYPITGSGPYQSAVIFCNPTTGYVDPTIGSQYPIYSVFGPTTTANSGNTVPLNAGLPSMYGSTVFRLNNNVSNYSAERLTKTFPVTTTNALFQFAYISVFYTSHNCCEAGAFSIKLTNATAGTIIPCPQFSVSAPSTQCSNSVSPQYYNTNSSTPATTSSSQIYNPWVFNSIDLTAYIGQTIQIDITASDCCYGGHYGYVYFDAQCGPMDIIGNGTSFPAGTPNITLPTCGTGNTATITAPNGLGPYQWTGPAGFTPSTAQTIVTGITGNYTLTMNPPGSCVPTVKTVSVVISPAPNVIVSSQTNYDCVNTTTNSAVIQMASGTPGSGTPQYTVAWSPSVTVGASSAQTQTVTGLTVGIQTVTITDIVGCTATATLNVTPVPPTPTFSISAPSGTMVGCNPPSITLNAVNTSTLSNVTFTWTSTQTGVQSNTNSIGGAVTSPPTNVYTITASDASVNSCVATQTFEIAANTTPPGCTVNPITGTVSCSNPCTTFTAITSSTTNILGQWFDGAGNPMGSVSSGTILNNVCSPGTYSVAFWDITNGCVSSKTVSVGSNTTVPTMTINTPNGTTITCSTPVLTLNISVTSAFVPGGYVWNSPFTGTTTSSTGGYSVNAPGTYTAYYTDGVGCKISQPITIQIDTVKPNPSSITNLPSGSFTLNCYYPVLTATAVTSPMLPITSYSWVQPSPSLVVATNTMQVNTTSVTANPTTFTVLAKGANGCVGRNKVLFYEDLVTPTYKVVFTPTAITCAVQNVAVSTQSITNPTGGPSTFTITSPSPVSTSTTNGTLFGIPGVYTATMTLVSNGCTVAATSATVPVNTTPPATVVTAGASIPCGSPTVMISAGTTTNVSYYQYGWVGPVGSGIGCNTCYVTSVNMPGEYAVSITNTVNGCVSSNVIDVAQGNGTMVTSFNASPTSGYAPLNVSVVNTTPLGTKTGTAPVVTSWSFGNGQTSYATQTSAQAGSVQIGGSPTYSAAGVYTITLYMTQSYGSFTCTGTSSAVVTVDLPSQLVIPNVFTPNGDKVNDVFMVNSTNITEITCIIFDRWGVKMYDVTSTTGNIAWDGKNLSGKDVPVGTYFYIITAKGKDDLPYEQKGTVSLYR